ncbi:hypothetical protein N7499_013326 [Penicillium canescens]|uniref:Uncharacterized protein n=1 Tax=Penicillium canescens TaxID=5083 RepID=A0AAD6N5B7_PENCN|nr:hypothetical protein N7460_011175 [Penicillium canescens]KAJ6064646.1 hypothetical protein N7499_013326 [Penicillium canescens]
MAKAILNIAFPPFDFSDASFRGDVAGSRPGINGLSWVELVCTIRNLSLAPYRPGMYRGRKGLTNGMVASNLVAVRVLGPPWEHGRVLRHLGEFHEMIGSVQTHDGALRIDNAKCQGFSERRRKRGEGERRAETLRGD